MCLLTSLLCKKYNLFHSGKSIGLEFLMSKLVLIIFSLCTFSSLAQGNEKNTEFHRLLIFNKASELMVVKIKNTEYWVTPGLYGQVKLDINNNLNALAAEFGLTISLPNLRGIFTLKNKKSQAESKRYFYNTNVIGQVIKKPDNIEEIRWLSLNAAVKMITFPHINMLINQVTNHPKYVWGGTILRYKDDNEFNAKLVEGFYPIENFDAQ